jgi:predicted membrane metal-binding protein
MKRCYFLLFLTFLRLFLYNFNPPETFLPKVDFEASDFVFRVVSEPKYYWHKQALEVEVDSSYKAIMYTETWPKYDLFDELKVKGSLSEIKNNSDFDYKKYLNKKDIFALCFYPRVYEVKKYSGKNVHFFFWNLKKKMFLKINKYLPEPANGLVKAMVLSSKSQLLPELKDRLERQGLAHILTVSGLHLGLLIYLFICSLTVGYKKIPEKINIIIKIRTEIIVITFSFGCLTFGNAIYLSLSALWPIGHNKTDFKPNFSSPKISSTLLGTKPSIGQVSIFIVAQTVSKFPRAI